MSTNRGSLATDDGAALTATAGLTVAVIGELEASQMEATRATASQDMGLVSVRKRLSSGTPDMVNGVLLTEPP